MDGGDVFPAEMPDDHPEPMVPLDDDTAERLLAGRLHPEDAPPGYGEVARVLRAAAGPPSPEELAGREAALAGFRAARDGSGPGRAEGDVARAHLRRRPPEQGPAAWRPGAAWEPAAAWEPGAVAPRCGPGWPPWRWQEC
jgi:hypothetical protein